MFCKDLFSEGAEAAARLEREVAPPAASAGTAGRTPSSRAFEVLWAAAGLGLFADLLLRPSPWGLNFALWTGLLVLAALGVAARSGYAWRPSQRGMLGGMLLLGAAFVWRDAPALAMVNLLGLVALGAWLAFPARTSSLRRSSLGPYLESAVGTATNVAVGFIPLVVSDARAGVARTRRLRDPAWRTARGVLFALPLLLFFGALFAAADARFEALASSVLRFDVAEVLSHGLVIGFFTWTAGGLLREVFVRHGGVSVPLPRFAPRLSALEVGIPLGVLGLLFLTFVALQVPYFFGGASFVEITSGLTYAQYARRGFFELVTAAAFVLPLLLFSDYLLRDEARAPRAVVRALAASLVALVLLVLASAWHRMHVYRAQFGWTELRLYTTVFMVWMGLVFVWLVATVLRDRRDRFPFLPIVTAFAVVALLNAVNPAGFIVRANAARAGAGSPFDAAYATSLGADAVPALLSALPSLEPDARCLVARRLGSLRPADAGDWRTWNVSRSRARRLLDERRSELIAMGGSCMPNP